MGKKLIEKVEFEIEETLHESGVRHHDNSTIGPLFYVPISLPRNVVKKLGEDAIESGYKPGEKIKYKITIERVR
jgi:hypothetical protein